MNAILKISVCKLAVRKAVLLMLLGAGCATTEKLQPPVILETKANEIGIAEAKHLFFGDRELDPPEGIWEGHSDKAGWVKSIIAVVRAESHSAENPVYQGICLKVGSHNDLRHFKPGMAVWWFKLSSIGTSDDLFGRNPLFMEDTYIGSQFLLRTDGNVPWFVMRDARFEIGRNRIHVDKHGGRTPSQYFEDEFGFRPPKEYFKRESEFGFGTFTRIYPSSGRIIIDSVFDEKKLQRNKLANKSSPKKVNNELIPDQTDQVFANLEISNGRAEAASSLSVFAADNAEWCNQRSQADVDQYKHEKTKAIVKLIHHPEYLYFNETKDEYLIAANAKLWCNSSLSRESGGNVIDQWGGGVIHLGSRELGKEYGLSVFESFYVKITNPEIIPFRMLYIENEGYKDLHPTRRKMPAQLNKPLCSYNELLNNFNAGAKFGFSVSGESLTKSASNESLKLVFEGRLEENPIVYKSIEKELSTLEKNGYIHHINIILMTLETAHLWDEPSNKAIYSVKF